MKLRLLVLLVLIGAVAAACSSDDSGDTTTTAAPDTTTTTAATTTTEATTTTTAATTTTEAATTTTEAVDAYEVAETPLMAELQPYSAGGAELFPAGSVQAHWYQWDGRYVILYRGFDASDGTPICAGNSAQESTGFNYITNSPHEGTVDEICNGVPKLAEAPLGVYACGSLLYYLTEVPVDTVANLFGTLEIVTVDGAEGQTSAVPFDTVVETPEFEPGLTAYNLPATTVDDGGVVQCS